MAERGEVGARGKGSRCYASRSVPGKYRVREIDGKAVPQERKIRRKPERVKLGTIQTRGDRPSFLSVTGWNKGEMDNTSQVNVSTERVFLCCSDSEDTWDDFCTCLENIYLKTVGLIQRLRSRENLILTGLLLNFSAQLF